MLRTILIVDDDPDAVELFRLVLKKAGYATRTAENGAEALSKAQSSPPDLVVLDVVLPDINGLTVCERLRRDPATASVPVILVTIVPGEFPRLVGMEAGADAYLHKPFHIEELVSRVASVLGRTNGPVFCPPRYPELTVQRELA